MTTRSFWPPAEAAQADYETLRAHLLSHGVLPDDLAAARFARRGLAGLIAWPAPRRRRSRPARLPGGPGRSRMRPRAGHAG